MNSIVVQPVFAGERAVFYRERAAGMYAVLPFSLSLVRPRLPPLLIVSGVMSCPQQNLSPWCFLTWQRAAVPISRAAQRAMPPCPPTSQTFVAALLAHCTYRLLSS